MSVYIKLSLRHDEEVSAQFRYRPCGKWGFGCPVPYKTLAEEEVEVEPVVNYNCDHCDYRSPTQKGLRCHLITVHRIGVGVRRTLDTHGRPLAYFDRGTSVAVWSTRYVTSFTAWIPISSVLFGLNLSHHSLLDTSVIVDFSVWSSLVTAWIPSSVLDRCTSVAVRSTSLVTSFTAWIHQVYSDRGTSVAVWSTSLVTSVTAWIPSSVLRLRHFSGCLDYKFSHISHCLDTIKCTEIAALQWLLGLQV
ncbi:hypothetical protein TNCT_564481 [Trichonephila clavata]|uniref:Uncharacterized protein n=1 Tax=Trichonephila clavata TaxID=2740835 RepID=A0A8X6L5J2_TRICU|nr:hypothetical protein TNCT_564481 [Trichonephila clavata]